MEFCHSFGESVSLACIESKEENEHLKEWLIVNGKFVIYNICNDNSKMLFEREHMSEGPNFTSFGLSGSHNVHEIDEY